MTERERLLDEAAEESARAEQYQRWADESAAEGTRQLWLNLAESKRRMADSLRDFAGRLDSILEFFDRHKEIE